MQSAHFADGGILQGNTRHAKTNSIGCAQTAEVGPWPFNAHAIPSYCLLCTFMI